MTQRHTFRQALAVALLVLLAACSKLTAANYDRVETGMSPQQVHDILGAPDEVGGGTLANFEVRNEVWRGHGQEIQISFLNGKVMRKWIGKPDSAASP
ncbi:hypothetical protein RM530_02540 [Algiphilus sp. W345]|uniref:Lipoprotein SmpA/OmlA domain-containing protein n=1 Tax=Banduia mediterranea TaxID=3075609 RepID=A0ABU2WEG7_9GAMM|nr:hypothetical protein [Algiphilus sp. W345]MDT0496245.1 hypothetical protein [Algiphilus sp. W345]